MKKPKAIDSTTQKVIGYFHDNPAAKVSSVAKQFKLSVPYVYKLRDKAAGKTPPKPSRLLDAVKETAEMTTLLGSRAKDYGALADNARLAQALKRAMAEHARDMDRDFADDQWEALEMIASKMARIVNGNADKADSWDDIAGYATLIADRLRGFPR